MNFADLFRRRGVEGTVVNQFGEGVRLGSPASVKQLKYEQTVVWNITKTSHISPFDTLLIHDGDTILRVIPVSLFRMDKDVKSLTIRMA